MQGCRTRRGPYAATRPSCPLSDAMAAPYRVRPSGMGSHCCRHSAASSPVTPNHRPQRSGGAGRGALERRPPASCAAPGRPAVTPSRCHAARGKVGHDAGGAFWRWQPSAPHAVRCSAFGPCRHCPMLTASFRWRRFCISQLTCRPAGCRCVRASERLQLWQPGSFLSPPASRFVQTRPSVTCRHKNPRKKTYYIESDDCGEGSGIKTQPVKILVLLPREVGHAVHNAGEHQAWVGFEKHLHCRFAKINLFCMIESPLFNLFLGSPFKQY